MFRKAYTGGKAIKKIKEIIIKKSGMVSSSSRGREVIWRDKKILSEKLTMFFLFCFVF